MHELEYPVFLNTLMKYFEIRLLCDHAKPADGKVCLLRHDVDHDIDRAIRMAEIEYDLDIQSTYFVLHTAGYYKESGFIEKCRYLQDMGHEVGLHNNIITAALGEPSATTEEILARELAFLRDGGLDVRGTVGHGDDLCHKLNFLNYQIFKGCEVKNRPDNVSGVEFYKIDMADYGLDYEGVYIKRNCYLSDSGGAWFWDYPTTGDQFSDYPKLGDPVKQPLESQDVIAHINNIRKIEEHFVLQVLAHPIWWPI